MRKILVVLVLVVAIALPSFASADAPSAAPYLRLQVMGRQQTGPVEVVLDGRYTCKVSAADTQDAYACQFKSACAAGDNDPSRHLQCVGVDVKSGEHELTVTAQGQTFTKKFKFLLLRSEDAGGTGDQLLATCGIYIEGGKLSIRCI